MRCFGCCQENCGYGQCACDCHEDRCSRCGLAGVHYCIGSPPRAIVDPDLIIKLAVPTRCNGHPKYKALRRPRTPCESCWRIWIAKNP